MKTKIFFLQIFLLCHAKPQFQLTQKQAQQVASQLKVCTPVNPPENMDYLSSFYNTWNVVKIYDAPVQQQHSIPPIMILKEDAGTFVSGAVPGIGNIKIPVDVKTYGHLFINHNMSIPVMGTPMAISLNVKATILDFEHPNFLLHGCGKILGPEFQMAIVLSQSTTFDPAYSVKVAPKLQTYGINAGS